MDYKYITFRHQTENELKIGINQFQKAHPEIDLYSYFSKYPQTQQLIKENATAEKTILSALDIEDGFPIEICNFLSYYVNLTKSKFKVSVNLSNIAMTPFYKDQIIELTITEPESRRSYLSNFISAYKVDLINGLSPEEFYIRRKAYITALRELKMTMNSKGLDFNKLFELACNPNYEVDKSFLVEIAKKSLAKPYYEMEMLVPPDRLALRKTKKECTLKEQFFQDYTIPEIECITKLDISPATGEFYVDFSTIPPELMNQALDVLMYKENAVLAIDATDEEVMKKLQTKDLDFRGVKIHYACNTVSQATEEIIRKFDRGLISIGIDDKNITTVEISRYRILLKRLRKLVKGISLNESEKSRFKKVYIRVGEQLEYDEDMIQEDASYHEYQKENAVTSRNLVNGLLRGKCVCAGMSEILRQALSLVNITSFGCSSQRNSKERGHRFNVVRINGNWYNADLTWDLYSIKEKSYPRFCLKSDQEFEDVEVERKKVFHKKRTKTDIKCSSSLELFKKEKLKTVLKEKIKEAIGSLSHTDLLTEGIKDEQLPTEQNRRKTFVEQIGARRILYKDSTSTERTLRANTRKEREDRE